MNDVTRDDIIAVAALWIFSDSDMQEILAKIFNVPLEEILDLTETMHDRLEPDFDALWEEYYGEDPHEEEEENEDGN